MQFLHKRFHTRRIFRNLIKSCYCLNMRLAILNFFGYQFSSWNFAAMMHLIATVFRVFYDQESIVERLRLWDLQQHIVWRQLCLTAVFHQIYFRYLQKYLQIVWLKWNIKARPYQEFLDFFPKFLKIWWARIFNFTKSRRRKISIL